MARQPFSMLRACFYLLAIVILIMMFETLLALSSCAWIVAVQGREPLGACTSMGGMIREIFSELLTGILALLVASRGGNGGPPKAPPE
jgi:hypothetical protein